MRRHLTIMLAMAATLLIGSGIAAAGGGGHGGTACRGFAQGQDLLMRDSCFEGTGHVVAAGQTITVTNAGELPHTVTAADGSFDSGTIQAGDTYEFTVEDPGVIPIYCTLHGSAEGDGMAGLLVAQTGDLATAEPASSPVSTRSVWPWVATVVLVVASGAMLARRRRQAV